jgi:hypothetical protein
MTKLSMNRRTFVQTSVTAGLFASLPVRTFAAMHEIEKVGVQLYTVRDDMKKDFAGTIAKVAGVGYKEVEFAGYFDHKPADVRACLTRMASLLLPATSATTSSKNTGLRPLTPLTPSATRSSSALG